MDGASTINSGDTAWMLVATTLVLFMMIPGLALFYAGLVRAKNVLSVFMQCFALTAVLSIVWLVCGYSLAFSDGNSLVGGLQLSFLAGVGADTPPRADAPVRASLSGRRGGFPLTPDGVAVRRLLGCRGAWVEADTEFGIGWVDRVCGRQLEPCS